MKKMENKKNIIIGCLIGGLVVLAGVIFAITSNKESKTNETLQTTGDIKKMLKTIYKNLANELPELTTEEINLKESELVESLTGLKSTDDINTLVVSEPVMGSQALEVAVIKTKEKTDITSMMQNIKDNVDTVIYDEFVKYMDNKVGETLEKGETLEELPDEYNGAVAE